MYKKRIAKYLGFCLIFKIALYGLLNFSVAWFLHEKREVKVCVCVYVNVLSTMLEP